MSAKMEADLKKNLATYISLFLNVLHLVDETCNFSREQTSLKRFKTCTLVMYRRGGIFCLNLRVVLLLCVLNYRAVQRTTIFFHENFCGPEIFFHSTVQQNQNLSNVFGKRNGVKMSVFRLKKSGFGFISLSLSL